MKEFIRKIQMKGYANKKITENLCSNNAFLPKTSIVPHIGSNLYSRYLFIVKSKDNRGSCGVRLKQEGPCGKPYAVKIVFHAPCGVKLKKHSPCGKIASVIVKTSKANRT